MQKDPATRHFLDALLRDIRARQDLVRAILEDDEDARRLDFTGSLQAGDNAIAAANRIRTSLGVFVLLIGTLGSYHSNISKKVFRGFAIADDLAPFIVINDQDARTARSFTLTHELVHLVRRRHRR